MAAITSNKRERPKGSVVVWKLGHNSAANENSASLKFPNAKRAHIIIDVTVITTSLDIVLKGLDPVSGKWYPLLTFAQIVGTGIVVGKFAPGITEVANLAVSDVLPETFRFESTIVGATTYTIGVNLIDE